MTMRVRSVVVAGALFVCAGALADESEWFVPLGPPPQAAPRRISGGEALPPLPLPATPLRRSERKREPSPPKIIGKVVWGESASFTYESGTTCEISDWNLCPADLQQLLRKAGDQLRTPYSSDVVNLTAFDGDPVKMPVLFFSGVRTVHFTPAQAEQVRDYVMRGGMIVCDSIAGSPYFYDSFKKAMAEMFPESVFRVIPLDHPLYHMVFDVQQASYPKNVDLKTPFLEGIYVGSRIGVLVSKYGMGCGWDDHQVPYLAKAAYYDVETASRLGVNIVAYCVGYANAAREEARPELFGSLDEKAPTDELVFAQIKHGGAWNTHPGAAASLLRRLRQNTSLRASLKRVPVIPGKEDLSPYPFLFLSGLDDWQLDAAGVAALRNFLNGAGTLLISNGLGMKTFSLEPIPATHPIFSSLFSVDKVAYTPAVTGRAAEAKAPYLEGITVNGDLRVIYSPYDVEGGWLECEYPLSKGYEPASAVQMGMNIVMYAMTH